MSDFQYSNYSCSPAHSSYRNHQMESKTLGIPVHKQADTVGRWPDLGIGGCVRLVGMNSCAGHEGQEMHRPVAGQQYWTPNTTEGSGSWLEAFSVAEPGLFGLAPGLRNSYSSIFFCRYLATIPWFKTAISIK